jgi:hypothetical protein
MSQPDDNYTAVLLEDVNSKLDAIIEVVVPMHKDVIILKEDVAVLKEDVAELKSDMKIVKHAIRETNLELRNHTHDNSSLTSRLSNQL